ncbi:hypothetical protein MVES1_003516 [Malassezia vespertilionis]|uniref:phosphoethanolamine N-methyltransferase n=1 Tax=Malassezia vespertilionis TaxID=2020962 RepID=A0A2N1J6Z1_9BASI|nr:uncharacterized protein MVES1_003516 [Malassezia vespertilionis]PKI82328.1 hypothetical protein MVES_003753 [Malassezia vespertilionis]WFD08146.1 hypothetical protein MVES1_003516 [Malassezia vespertilionis]
MADEAYQAVSHLALNVVRPSTEWLNMGNWEHTNEFPAACHALAEQLHSAAQIPSNARILDVGHGCGDSLLLLASQHEPQCLHGITSIPAHAKRAQQRIGARAMVWCADATQWLADTTDQCSVHGEHARKGEYDTILALDCAYHFQNRPAFFRSAFQQLKPGGALALVDLVGAWPYPEHPAYDFVPSTLAAPKHGPSVWQRLRHRVVCYLTGTPPGSFVSMDNYATQLQHAGFSAVSIQDISHAIFPGFSSFLQGMGAEGEAAWRGGSRWLWR